MTDSQPSKPKRSRRMVVWMVAVPIVILLLALAGANWKRFHLAYAKHLMRSDDRDKQAKGIDMVLKTHVRVGMSLEEVRRRLAPARVTETVFSKYVPAPVPLRPFEVCPEDEDRYFFAELGFDRNDRLREILTLKDRSVMLDQWLKKVPPPRK